MKLFAPILILYVLCQIGITVAEAQATEHTAYQIKSGIVGNQEFGGALGMDFIPIPEVIDHISRHYRKDFPTRK